MGKKGVEMSLNVIIVAAIGLLILVILAFLVINYVGKTQQGLESCNIHGGKCAATCDNGPVDLPQGKTSWDCKSTAPLCCKILAGQ